MVRCRRSGSCFLLKQACLSLSEAHALGLVHRDIKPANLFVCRLGSQYDFLKVLDFGVGLARHAARRPRRSPTAGMILGTPAFSRLNWSRPAGVRRPRRHLRARLRRVLAGPGAWRRGGEEKPRGAEAGLGGLGKTGRKRTGEAEQRGGPWREVVCCWWVEGRRKEGAVVKYRPGAARPRLTASLRHLAPATQPPCEQGDWWPRRRPLRPLQDRRPQELLASSLQRGRDPIGMPGVDKSR